MYNKLSIKKNIYILRSIYTFIPQKRIGFSNSYFIEWAGSCRPIITDRLLAAGKNWSHDFTVTWYKLKNPNG